MIFSPIEEWKVHTLSCSFREHGVDSLLGRLCLIARVCLKESADNSRATCCGNKRISKLCALEDRVLLLSLSIICYSKTHLLLHPMERGLVIRTKKTFLTAIKKRTPMSYIIKTITHSFIIPFSHAICQPLLLILLTDLILGAVV